MSLFNLGISLGHACGIVVIGLMWMILGAALMWCHTVYRPAARRRKMNRIALAAQAELDNQAPASWEKYLA